MKESEREMVERVRERWKRRESEREMENAKV